MTFSCLLLFVVIHGMLVPSFSGQGKAAYTGDFILSSASVALAKLRHNRVMQIMSEILENLVKGK